MNESPENPQFYPRLRGLHCKVIHTVIQHGELSPATVDTIVNHLLDCIDECLCFNECRCKEYKNRAAGTLLKTVMSQCVSQNTLSRMLSIIMKRKNQDLLLTFYAKGLLSRLEDVDKALSYVYSFSDFEAIGLSGRHIRVCRWK
jgi:hypothetical protein